MLMPPTSIETYKPFIRSVCERKGLPFVHFAYIKVDEKKLIDLQEIKRDPFKGD